MEKHIFLVHGDGKLGKKILMDSQDKRSIERQRISIVVRHLR